METATIQGEKREPGGKHANDRLRRRGMLPAVVYGHGEAPETLALSRHDTLAALEHAAHVITVEIDGKQREFLVKEVQYDHLQKNPIHLDLMRFDSTERVTVRIEVQLRGTPKGVTENQGSLVQLLPDIEVECRVLDIPEALRVRVDHLGIDEALHVKDIELPGDVKAMHEPDDVVAIVQPPRVVAEDVTEGEEGEAGGAEPEIIGKGKEEGEGAADGE